MPEPAEVDMIRCGDRLPLTAAHGLCRRHFGSRHAPHRRQRRARGGEVWGRRRDRPCLQGPRAVEQASLGQPESCGVDGCD